MLRIRHLLIQINTDKGVFGTRQNFTDGLNVIRAENYAGKSQLVQSIMYALGMEGMQGPSHAVPLAHALTEYLDYYVNGKKMTAKVIDSMVSIEIENGKGKFLTVQRAIAGDRNRHLIVVDPIFWTRKGPFLRWWAALKMEKSQCHEPARVTRPA